MPKTVQRPSKEYLEQAYTIEEKSLRTIGDKHDCAPQTVAVWLHHYGIPIRGWQDTRRILQIPKEDLVRLYERDKMTSAPIGEMYGISQKSVLNMLHENGIHVRPKGSQGVETKVCKILRAHAEDLKDDPERLSTEFMQDMIGVRCNRQTIRT